VEIALSIENMNHPLKEASDYISIGQIQELSRDSSSRPLQPELKETLSGWLEARLIN